jgi:hypothetical protein
MKRNHFRVSHRSRTQSKTAPEFYFELSAHVALDATSTLADVLAALDALKVGFLNFAAGTFATDAPLSSYITGNYTGTGPLPYCTAIEVDLDDESESPASQVLDGFARCERLEL